MAFGSRLSTFQAGCPARNLSDLGLIYCEKAGFGQIFRSFSLNSYGYSPQTIEKYDFTMPFGCKPAFLHNDRLSLAGSRNAPI